MTVRRRRHPAPRIAEDGVDDQLWEYMADLIDAAHQGDLARFHAKIQPLSDYLEQPNVHGEPGVMLTYLIKHRIYMMLGGRVATVPDLESIGAASQLAFQKIVQEKEQLVDLLAQVWDLAPGAPRIKRAEYILVCLAAVGVLLDDPARQLAEMRRPTAAWYRLNMEKYLPGVNG